MSEYDPFDEPSAVQVRPSGWSRLETGLETQEERTEPTPEIRGRLPQSPEHHREHAIRTMSEHIDQAQSSLALARKWAQSVNYFSDATEKLEDSIGSLTGAEALIQRHEGIEQ